MRRPDYGYTSIGKVGGGDVPAGVRLPETHGRTGIDPELSNLPPGRAAFDPPTGEHHERRGEDERPADDELS